MNLWKPPKAVRSAINRGDKKVKAGETKRSEQAQELLERKQWRKNDLPT